MMKGKGSVRDHLLADGTDPLFEQPITQAFGMVKVFALQRRHLLPIANLIETDTASKFARKYIYCCPPTMRYTVLGS